MHRLKTFKLLSRLFSLSLLLLIISCSTKKSKLSENNYFLKNYFYNDSLKVGIDFDKNIEFREASLVKEKEYSKFLKGTEKLSSKDLFLVADSKEKGTETYFFYQNIKSSNDSLAVSKIIFNDTINNVSLFEKQKGKRKVLGLVKTISSKDKNSSIYVTDIISKITIDSLNTRKMSFPAIFINNFPGVHPNPLYASKKLETAPLKSKGGNDDKFQLLSTVNASMSNNKLYDSLIVGYEKERKEKFNSLIVDLSSKDDVYKDNAVFLKIAEIAKENQVLMLNEDHYYPKHRLFAMELLETLKANGYTYLSLEAFVADPETDFTPNYNNGIYTDEPYFAHFIRKAITLGFTVSGHENVDKGIDREMGQAKNILKILEKDSNAKIFVYVGHSHIEKEKSKRKWMAEYFKELSGINPITINQTVICADTKQDLTLVPRKYLTDTTKITSSADYFLINNLKPSLKKIYPNAVFKETKIKNTVFSKYKNKEILVEVIDSKEFDLMKNMAIPIESYLRTPKNSEIKLELPIGSYHVLVKTEDNETIYDDTLLVN